MSNPFYLFTGELNQQIADLNNPIDQTAQIEGVLNTACPLKFQFINEQSDNLGIAAGLLGGSCLLLIFHIITTG